MELDTHADTCALGDACIILGDSGDVVDVGGFGEGVGVMKDVKIVHGAVAYDCPETYKTFVLIYHQALHVPGMEVHLLNPFQMREQGITVNDIPLQQLSKDQRTKSSHSIISEDPELTMPLSIQGTMSGFTVRKPTWDEVLDDGLAVKVHMTSHSKWKPNSRLYAEVEEALRRDIDRDVVLCCLVISPLLKQGDAMYPPLLVLRKLLTHPLLLPLLSRKPTLTIRSSWIQGTRW